MADGILKLRVVDVYGKPLEEGFDVFLRNQIITHNVAVRNVESDQVEIRGLHQNPEGLYLVEVDAPSYLAVRQFVRVPTDDDVVKVPLPVNKDRIVGVVFPKFDELNADAKAILGRSDGVALFSGKVGADLYEAFDPVRKAGFLNLVAKASATLLSASHSVLFYIERITEQRGDRFFALVSPELHGEVDNLARSGRFDPADDSLHVPPPGFKKVNSYKTHDHYGNLQLTFSQKGSVWSLDMDIDDAKGFEHIFQVVRNVAGPTNPYNIHEILLQYQKLDPGYQFILASDEAKHA